MYPLSDADEGADKKPEGESVERLKTQINLKTLGLEPAQLFGLKGQLYSYRFPRAIPSPTPPVFERVYHDLNRIRSR